MPQRSPRHSRRHDVRRLRATIRDNSLTQRAPVVPGSKAIYVDPNSSHEALQPSTSD